MITPQIRKAFSIASLVGATLKSSNNGSPRMLTLQRQCNAAMRVFNHKSRREYYIITDQVYTLWGKIAERHNNTLDVDEIEVFCEMLLNLMPKEDMKKFLGFTFTTKNKLRDEKKSEILMTILDVDSELNALFGTVATSNRDSISKVMVKPVKVAKSAVIRDVGVPTRIKKLRKRIKWVKSRVI
jgi:hypothetical protein